MDGLDPEQLAPMVKNLSNADQQEIMTLLNRSQQQAQVGESTRASAQPLMTEVTR